MPIHITAYRYLDLITKIEEVQLRRPGGVRLSELDVNFYDKDTIRKELLYMRLIYRASGCSYLVVPMSKAQRLKIIQAHIDAVHQRRLSHAEMQRVSDGKRSYDMVRL